MSLKTHTKIITKGPSFEARTSADIDDTVIILRVNQLTPESFEELKEGVATHLERINKLGISKYKEIITEPKSENPKIPPEFVFVNSYLTISGEYDLYLNPVMIGPACWRDITMSFPDYPDGSFSLPDAHEMPAIIAQYLTSNRRLKEDFKSSEFLWCRDKTIIRADNGDEVSLLPEPGIDLKCNYFRVLRVHK